jgi:hypothetical protein
MLISRVATVFAVILVLILTTTGHLGFADDPKDKKSPKDQKSEKEDTQDEKHDKTVRTSKTRSKMEDVLTRAVVWARKTASENQGFCRATVVLFNGSEDVTFIVSIEFYNGSVALFQGGNDAEDDNVVVLGKEHLPLLQETIDRSKVR